jgi:hypothetical protein
LASSTTKTGRHCIDEIFLKVALSTKNQINQSQMHDRFLLYLGTGTPINSGGVWLDI